MQDERKLQVWQEGMTLARDIYLVKYHPDEKFGIQSQIRRAASSIPALIAEGCGRETAKDVKHYFVQSRGSCKEVQTFLELSKNLGFIDTQTYTPLYSKANQIGAMLTNLIKAIKVGESNEKE